MNENYIIRIKYKVDMQIESNSEKSLYWAR
jgi:hypothetical protein